MKPFNFNLFATSIVSGLALLAPVSFAATSVSSFSNSLETITINRTEQQTPESRTFSVNDGDDSTASVGWWLDWDTVTASDAIMKEGHTCATLAQEVSITVEQQEALMNNCEDVIFYDSFDTEEGNGFKTLTGKSPVRALPYGSFKKWNSYGNGAMLLKHSSPWVQARLDGHGYAVALSTIHGGTRIETKGPISLEAGNYQLMFKLKASTEKILPKYVGVTTLITGGHTNIKQHDYVRSFYTNPHWDTVSVPFSVSYNDEIVLSLEDIFNGMKDRGSVVDGIVIIKNINAATN